MAPSVGAPRQMLRRLREVMAEHESAQARLDKVVMLIASNIVAEVCSLYLRRRDGSLELVATEGLNIEAVHSTHLKPGEGLVGLVAEQAEPKQFADAQHHPAFSFRPDDLTVISEAEARRYGHPTPKGEEAKGLLSRLEGLVLDSTYTAKAVAALIERPDLPQPLLYWHTLNAHPLPTSAQRWASPHA